MNNHASVAHAEGRSSLPPSLRRSERQCSLPKHLRDLVLDKMSCVFAVGQNNLQVPEDSLSEDGSFLLPCLLLFTPRTQSKKQR